MNEGFGQLMAFITLALILLLMARFLWRATPFGTWVALPFPGRGLLRRALAVLLVLAVVGVLLDALTVERGQDRERRLPVYVVDSKKTPEIAKHVRAALAAGHPSVLTRAPRAVQQANRRAVCGTWRGPGSCDEYPFASTYEGGRGASTAGVPLREQLRQGGSLLAFYEKQRVRVGDRFLVVVK